MSVNGTLVEAKMCTFIHESTHFIFNKCPIYILDGASAKFSTVSHGTDYSVDSVLSKYAGIAGQGWEPFNVHVHCRAVSFVASGAFSEPLLVLLS